MPKKPNKWNNKKIETLIRKKMRERLKLAAEYVEGEAKIRCPVDTNTLRSSITHSVPRYDRARIGTNVEYAPYVELGTIYMAPRPFLRRALIENRGAVRRILEL